MSSTIALVMDRHFGSRVIELARQMPVWIVSSSTNDAGVEQARATLGGAVDVTTIFETPAEPADEGLFRALCAIDEHHGPDSSSEPYEEIAVIGAQPALLKQSMMKDLGLRRTSVDQDGFRLSKPVLGAKAAT